MIKVKLDDSQIAALKKLWFIYGNQGRKSTLFNHKYIQGFLEVGEDRKEPYVTGRIRLTETGRGEAMLTDECIAEVESIVYK